MQTAKYSCKTLPKHNKTSVKTVSIKPICFFIDFDIFNTDLLLFSRWIYCEQLVCQNSPNLSASFLRCGLSPWISVDSVDSVCLFWLAAKTHWQFSNEGVIFFQVSTEIHHDEVSSSSEGISRVLQVFRKRSWLQVLCFIVLPGDIIQRTAVRWGRCAQLVWNPKPISTVTLGSQATSGKMMNSTSSSSII